MTSIRLYAGDNRESLRRLIDAGVRVHSVVTDPPYNLQSIVRRFGKTTSKPAVFADDGYFQRTGKGFMGMRWDASQIERDPEFWKLVYDILLPGGCVFAFSSPRTGHWQACAMEMAGFIMHPFHGWLYGQGMPHCSNAAREVDRHLGKLGERVPAGKPVKRMIPGADQNATGSWIKDNGREYQPGTYAPGTEEGAQWDGWSYGTQSQMPAMEPIYLAQKPFSERTGGANLVKHGVGAFNIKDCKAPRGNWPANVLHDGSPEVRALFPAEAGAKAPVRGTEPTRNGYSGAVKYSGMIGRINGEHTFYGDRPSAADFFNAFPLDELAIALYNAKAAAKDRAGSDHPTVKPVALLRHLVRHLTPPGGIVLDMFAGTGTTGEAARQEGFDCILMDAEPAYCQFMRKRFRLPMSKATADLLGIKTADLL